jgi:outer membrane protein assembly factor BamD
VPTRCSVLIVLLSWTLFFGGCASGPEKRPRVSYRTSAKENFLKGKKAFEDKDYLEAAEFFKFVKSKFPYSAYATDSDLYLADCDFERDRFIEAADKYRNFVKLHPKNKKVPYALFRVGLCHFEQIPDDWWFSPPAYEMDQTETGRTIREFEVYLERFPNDENAPKAQEHLKKCKVRMAQQVMYVLDFYRKKEHPRGVLWRADELLKKYSGLGYDEEALFYKAEALVDLEDSKEARATLHELLSRFPEGDYASRAKKMLSKLGAEPEKITVKPIPKAKPKTEPEPARAPKTAPKTAPAPEKAGGASP